MSFTFHFHFLSCYTRDILRDRKYNDLLLIVFKWWEFLLVEIDILLGFIEAISSVASHSACVVAFLFIEESFFSITVVIIVAIVVVSLVITIIVIPSHALVALVVTHHEIGVGTIREHGLCDIWVITSCTIHEILVVALILLGESRVWLCLSL